MVDVANADIIATLLELKSEVEEKSGTKLKLVLSRATEAHLLAPALYVPQFRMILFASLTTGSSARADVGVILVPSRPYPAVWDMARMCVPPPSRPPIC